MRKLARKVVETMAEEIPVIGRLAKVSTVVGSALMRPARAARNTVGRQQPGLLEFMMGGRQPDVLL